MSESSNKQKTMQNLHSCPNGWTNVTVFSFSGHQTTTTTTTSSFMRHDCDCWKIKARPPSPSESICESNRHMTRKKGTNIKHALATDALTATATTTTTTTKTWSASFQPFPNTIHINNKQSPILNPFFLKWVENFVLSSGKNKNILHSARFHRPFIHKDTIDEQKISVIFLLVGGHHHHHPMSPIQDTMVRIYFNRTTTSNDRRRRRRRRHYDDER